MSGSGTKKVGFRLSSPERPLLRECSTLWFSLRCVYYFPVRDSFAFYLHFKLIEAAVLQYPSLLSPLPVGLSLDCWHIAPYTIVTG